MVRHNQTGPAVSYDVLYDQLVQFEPHVLASRAKKAAKNHDPLALIAHSNASSSHSHANSSYSPQPYYVTHPPSVVDYDDEYQGELQGDSQEDKLTTAMMLLARAISQKFSTPTNNRYGGNANKNAGRNRTQGFNASDKKVMLMARLQPADENAETVPSYDAKAISQVIQLVLWIVDSGCLKHMTGNLQLLRNFIEKFMGTVRFGNDHFGAITGYEDYVQGNLTICHVYYVEGLGHNLFPVGQFCDGDLEVAFRSNTCYVRNLEGDDLLTGSRDSNLYTISFEFWHHYSTHFT
ncbi:hypothetical protein Tco_0955251 [Tanacetum coccineum]|uniref:Retrovirus-related Pol polyprotein from transposon TNT 1-94-like beta-barrel domain-containing protein n=1 Tax=Tanacetum coccineum TaxID=301880 RepID=A0ABQ5E6Q7_9ASTR